MNTAELLSSIDSEIATLKQARALLAGQDGHVRPTAKPAKKHMMSAEGRARIAAAQKARWAKVKASKKK
jgi:hypothetical protein